MTQHFRITVLLLGLAAILAGCASNKLSTDYLKARAAPPLKIPKGLEVPRPSNNEFPLDNLSAAELKSLHPRELFRPPQIVDANTPQESEQGQAKGSSVAELKSDANGAVFLEIALPYDRAWSRVHLGLLSSGFTMTDMNRSAGQFYIRYRDPEAGKGDPDQFVLNLLEVSGGSRLLVRNHEGQIQSGDVVRHILSLVRDNI